MDYISRSLEMLPLSQASGFDAVVYSNAYSHLVQFRTKSRLRLQVKRNNSLRTLKVVHYSTTSEDWRHWLRTCLDN